MTSSLINAGIGFVTGSQTSSWWGSMLAGATTTALWEAFNAKDTEINYSDTFTMDLVEFDEASLESDNGIGMSVGDVTYDYDTYYGTSGSTTDTSTSTASSNVNYSSETLTASLGLKEIRELEFTNPGALQNDSIHEPWKATLVVTGHENVYDTDYNYDYVKEKAEARGEDLSGNNGDNWFEEALSWLGSSSANSEEVAQITDEDLTIEEVRDYESKFHLLFTSFDYHDVGSIIEQKSCDVDGKSGVTGPDAVPRMKLAWGWSDISATQCDSQLNPNGYKYCDTTQFMISTFKKIFDIEEFFKQYGSQIVECPSSIENLGTNTQELDTNSLDVGIVSIEASEASAGAKLTAVVKTTNNLPMSATVTFRLTKEDGTQIDQADVCPSQTQTFTSLAEFTCEIDSNDTGVGKFNVDAIMVPTMCSGCTNSNTANDKIQTTLVIGSNGTQQCLKYSTSKTYFENTLAANNMLTQGDTVLDYLSFKTNLLKDGFSNDFKEDFDDYLMQLSNLPSEYESTGLREIFTSSKFKVDWPQEPAAWNAGKYDARIIITFAQDSWTWDVNNIESIEVELLPQGDPDPYYPIYNVAFNGMVGLNSDNGRVGYGSGYTQMTEDVFVVNGTGSSRILAQPNSSGTPLTNVDLWFVTGESAFYSLNSTPTRGNVLKVSEVGDDVQITLTPSVAVPLILTIDSGDNIDAYAFYQAEVNGSPQETGPTFISWTGIGSTCYDFLGNAMTTKYNKQFDGLASTQLQGRSGYGLYWPMVEMKGRVNLYGSFFTPQDSQTILKMLSQSQTATFESTGGNVETGTVTVNTAGEGIESLQDVFDLVADERICVVSGSGDFYWNNDGLRVDLASSIAAKETDCITR